jgi:hypothetical protein
LQVGQPCETFGKAGFEDHQEADADLHARGFAPRTACSANPLDSIETRSKVAGSVRRRCE